MNVHEKLDALAVIDKDRAALVKAYGEVMAAHDGYLAEHDKMRAAVAELIEAAISVHAACRARKEPDLISLADALDGVGAKRARKDALARVGGVYPTPSGHDIGCVEHPPGHAQACSCGARVGGGV